MVESNLKKSDQCTEFREHVKEFLEGTLPEDLHLRLEKHRLECPACAKVLLEEEKILSLMSELPEVEVPGDFRDRVLRAWRVRRETVRDTIPVASFKRAQVIFAAIVVILLLLPMVRIQLITSASKLLGALDRLPPEYREGIRLTFSIPTWAEIIARFQVWQGMLFESLGNFGTVAAPWTGWMLLAVAGLAILVVVNFLYLRTRLPIGPVRDRK